MSNILSYATAAKALQDIKSAIRESGGDVSSIDDISDVATAIRNQLVSGPSAVINATLASGPGIKVTPVDKKGYKISANSGATLTEDLTKDLPKGTSVHKVLYDIVYNQIPGAVKEATQMPAIVGVEVFKAPYDGVDFYDNKAFGRRGQGRKSGLHPDDWYVKIYMYAQVEPLYVSLAASMEDMKKEIMQECMHYVDSAIKDAIDKAFIQHIEKYHDSILGPNPFPPHRPHRPCPKPDWDDFNDVDPGFSQYPDGHWHKPHKKPCCTIDPNKKPCDICEPDCQPPKKPCDICEPDCQPPKKPCDICVPPCHKPKPNPDPIDPGMQVWPDRPPYDDTWDTQGDDTDLDITDDDNNPKTDPNWSNHGSDPDAFDGSSEVHRPKKCGCDYGLSEEDSDFLNSLN